MACLQEWQKTENKNALSTTERERETEQRERKKNGYSVSTFPT